MSSNSKSSGSLNIPVGNSPISSEPPERSTDDALSGDTVRDYRSAISRIDVKPDLENIGRVPCARNSLLYGIGGGTALGAVRYLGSHRPRSAANWAIASFMSIAIIQWEMCQRARAKELQQMRTIQEKYPHRHVSNVRKREE